VLNSHNEGDKLEKIMERLERIKEALKSNSRIKYIIVNLIELKENGWPESKNKREGPKKLNELYQDIENERQALETKYKRTYYTHDSNEEVGYRKKDSDKMQYGKFATLATEESDEKFDKHEILDKITEHLLSYINDPSTISFNEFISLKANTIPTSEVILKIFTTIAGNSHLLSKANKQLITYIYSFADKTLYEHKELIQGINKYIQEQFEEDNADNVNLNDFVVDLYLHALNKNYCTLEDVHLVNKKDNAEEFFNGRLNLAHGIMEKYKDKEELKRFFKEQVETMVKLSDPEELDEELIKSLKRTYN
jgi:hypothetical protein